MDRVFASGIARILVLLALVAAPRLRAQVVETPQPFDSAGRVMAITPALAARLALAPPGWSVTGDFTAARLYSTTGDALVLVVTRRDGALERYPFSAEDRAGLRQQLAAVPRGMLAAPDEGERVRFVRNQTVLGALIYAPAFSDAVTNDAAGGVSSYLLIAGGTFFGVSQLSHHLAITESMRRLSTHAAVRGAMAGSGIAYAAGTSSDGRSAGTVAGGFLGTAAGLVFGRRMTPAEEAASSFGADLLVLTTLGVMEGTTSASRDGLHASRDQVAGIVGAGIVGYPLGLAYARRAGYNLTAGDVGSLWTTGTLGVAAAAIPLVNGRPSRSVTAIAVTGGFLAGVVAGDRIFARRFDLTRADATLIGLGAAAGGLMGSGVAVLVDSKSGNDALFLSAATVGGVVGMAAVTWFAAPSAEQRRLAGRLDIHVANLALAAAGVPGRFRVASLTF